MTSPESLGVTRTAIDAAVGALEVLGFPASAWMKAAGADPDAAVVTPAVSDGLLEAAAEALSEEGIGLRIGETVPIGGLGMLDYALCVKPTWRAALEIVTSNFHLMSRRVRAELREDGTSAVLELTRLPGVAHSRHWIEFTFGLLLQRMRQTLGHPAELDDAELVHVAPTSLVVHDRVFGCVVRFQRPVDRILFGARMLDEPLRTSELSLAPILEEKVRALTPDRGDPFLSDVKAALAAMLEAGELDLQVLARRLRTSTRTLQRELGARRTSFKALLDDLRRTRAVELLRRGDRSVTEVAYALGFADPSAFFRAFRRWTGTAPNAYRARSARQVDP